MRIRSRILDIHPVTQDVKCFRIEKPQGYSFTPGQATDVSINQQGLEEELRPFTYTALNEKPYLEFTIKRYADRHGVTDKLHQLVPGDELLIGEPWGAISYQGPGYFIAGGAGITPFISILRKLHKDGQVKGNTLIFSNKTSADIIYEKELVDILGDRAIFILTKEEKQGYTNDRIDANYIRKNITDLTKHFYICGPDQMISDISGILHAAGVSPDTVVFEK
ncbi:MAG: oxidoreductase FAD/NAD(P)-binding domain protein [Bacteroidetes bacterium]|nr:oxidoreductase FAD/NAD(P)-binding domain protein [Bacteroidota bacterium]